MLATMNTCTITKLARAFGLSRSTLLYYDRIGLLPPSGRTAAGYRCYTQRDRQRLERICHFRQAGLTLADIRTLLSSSGKPNAKLLERRFRELGGQLLELRSQQRLLASMLKGVAAGKCPPAVDRVMWVKMLRAAGMDDRAMGRWHTEFERRAPDAHQEFLVSLGIPESEIQRIRKSSAEGAW
jgi:DNA-binding transcriptional MerR regulator